MLSGGCTYDGGNVAKKGMPCEGNAQLWNRCCAPPAVPLLCHYCAAARRCALLTAAGAVASAAHSTDLKTFTYMKPITPGGPGPYWELPYVLPFTKDGKAIDNYHHSR